uniref:Choline kinase n=1 Tax=Panagrolaimus sp. JU765 TaxID=591449 RepID=A0AC34Q9K8_9BILA
MMDLEPSCSIMDVNGDEESDVDDLVIKKVPTSGRRDFKEMPIQHDKHLRSMKEVLSTMDPNAEPNSHLEFKEKTHILCARFLGGAWKTVSLENMKITRIKGGMSNMLFLCRLTENHPPIDNEPDKVLLRVYFNPETESHLVAESVIFTLLSERHLGPKLYGIFSGGRLEEYIPSRPLHCAEIAVPTISNKIARRLAHVHQLEVPIWKEPDYLCDALERWLHQLATIPSAHSTFDLPESYHEFSPKTLTIKDLEEEIEFLRQRINYSTSKVSFCHNDLQEGNILLPKASSGNIRLPVSDESTTSNSLSAFNPHDPRLVLIDFEYASYNYRGFDFANHFVEYSINYDIDEPPYYEIHPEDFPSTVHMFKFMMSYLSELNPNKSEASLRSAAEAMVEETLPFIPVSHLFWGVWGLLQVEVSPVGFGFAEYGRDRLGLYFQNKHLLDKLQ